METPNKTSFLVLLMGLFLSFNGLLAQEKKRAEYTSVGQKMDLKNVLTHQQINERYATLTAGDSVNVKFAANVITVCKNKGCWMTLDLGPEQEVMVKFRDYAFFVPRDIEEKEVIVNGVAYVTEVSVEEQRHYAEDEGKSTQEIQAITRPKKTWSFMADAVLIKKE